MVSGKPPRRSKTTDEPVTIDLQAENSEQKAEPVAESDHQKTAADEVPDPISDRDPEPASEPAASSVPDATAKETEVVEDQARQTGFEEQPSEKASAGNEPEAGQNTKSAQITRSPRTSSLIASGIVGGLVALLLAGSMQYAGIIPGLGAPQTPPAGDGIAPAEIAEIRAEIERLSQAPAQTSAPDSALIERMDALERSIQQQSDTPTFDPAAIEALRAEIAANQQLMNELRTRLDTTVQTQTETEARLAEAEEKLNEPRNDVELARAIALTSLKTSIERGGPFLSELDALRAVAPEDATIAALQPFAANGVPSRSDLASRFNSVADDILIAVNQPGSGETWTERLMSSARSVISVRPVGNVEGSAPEAIVARIEDKLRNGDLKGAHLEWETLPEAGKSVSSQFADSLSQRVEIEAIINSAVARSIAGTEG